HGLGEACFCLGSPQASDHFPWGIDPLSSFDELLNDPVLLALHYSSVIGKGTYPEARFSHRRPFKNRSLAGPITEISRAGVGDPYAGYSPCLIQIPETALSWSLLTESA